MNHIDEIVNWQKERLLDKMTFKHQNETRLIIEELLEGFGVKDELGKDLSKRYAGYLNSEGVAVDGTVDEHELVDCYCDIIVYAVGAILKQGYDPSKALEQCLLEIGSRTGEIVNGKFEKDKSEEAKARWYTARYDECRIAKQD